MSASGSSGTGCEAGIGGDWESLARLRPGSPSPDTQGVISSMPECVATEVANSIYQRAKHGCECDNRSCAHPSAKCGAALKDWGVDLPEGTSEPEHLAKGRATPASCALIPISGRRHGVDLPRRVEARLLVV